MNESPAPPPLTGWYLFDMDLGLMRREPTRTAAVQWFKGLRGDRVIERHSHGPGAYEYRVGHDEYDCDSLFVESAASLRRDLQGWDPHQVPLYPHPNRPYERVERDGNEWDT